MDFREKVLEDLPPYDVSVFRLRKKLIGGVVDPVLMDGISFKIKADSKTYYKWERLWNKDKNKIVLVTNSQGIICNIDLFEWHDILIDDYLGATEIHGWYCTENCSTVMENKIMRDIQSILVEPSVMDVDKIITTCINLFKPDASKVFSRSEQEYYLCGFAVEVYNTRPALARLSASVLFRHIQVLESSDPIIDIPFLCGRLGLLPECICAIAYILEKRLELAATAWCNIGAVLTDNVRSPGAGLQCFYKAIEMDPLLPQPRQGVWHAGRRLMHRCFERNDYLGALEVAKQVTAVGSLSQAPHGFFSYVGLAYEMVGQKKDALISYKKALSIDSSCPTSQAGKKRVQTTLGTEGAITSIRKLIDSNAVSSFTAEDRYPWN